MSRVRAWLELMRLSNLPTVWTNALVGLYAGLAALIATTGQSPPVGPGPLLLTVLNEGFVLIVALSCFYVAGMVLNDVLDEEVDRVERPGRPIPSGRVRVKRARILLAVLFIVGLLGLSLYGQQRVLILGLLLVLAIVAYDVFHRRSPMMVGVMGLCRALVYLTAAAALPADLRPWLLFVGPFAACAFVYIVLITVVSRREVSTALGRAKWAAPLIVPVALAPALIVRPEAAGWPYALGAGALLVLWLTRGVRHALTTPPRTPQAIMTWLSGLCLLDAWFLTLLGQPLPAMLCILCWALTTLAHRRVAGT